MIIDCHSHIWPCRGGLGQAVGFSCLCSSESAHSAPEDHWAACDPAEVVLVLGFRSRHLGADIPNDFIGRYVGQHRSRLVGFAGIDPTEGQAGATVRALAAAKEFSGLTVSPACQGFHPCDSRAMGVYEAAQEAGMPIVFLNGLTLPKSAFLEYAQVQGLDEVARTFPELRIVISHLGYPFIDHTIALLAKHANVFADVAGLASRPWLAYRSLNMAYECGVIEKLLFASDFPSHTVKTAVEALYNLNKITRDSLLPAVPREHLRGIVERDSLSLLGLNHVVAERPEQVESSGLADPAQEP